MNERPEKKIQQKSKKKTAQKYIKYKENEQDHKIRMKRKMQDNVFAPDVDDNEKIK